MPFLDMLERLAGKSDGYFPPAGYSTRRRIRKALVALDGEAHRLERAQVLSRERGCQPFEYELADDQVLIKQDGRSFVLPRPLPMVKYVLLTSGYVRWLERKYSLPGFCEVEPGDQVVDCGGYIGGFGLFAGTRARRVDFFEPDPVNFRCLESNTAAEPTLHAHPIGLFDKSGTLAFNRSESSVEHSFLTPDDGTTSEIVEAEIMRFDHFARDQEIEEVDFFKLEAEGVEIEVFEGIGDVPVRKFVVDAGAEREGTSPKAYFVSAFQSRGYEVRTRGKMVFARRR